MANALSGVFFGGSEPTERPITRRESGLSRDHGVLRSRRYGSANELPLEFTSGWTLPDKKKGEENRPGWNHFVSQMESEQRLHSTSR